MGPNSSNSNAFHTFTSKNLSRHCINWCLKTCCLFPLPEVECLCEKICSFLLSTIVLADSGTIKIYFLNIVNKHCLHVWYPLSYLIIRIDDIVPSFWLYILLCHNLLTARTRLPSLCVSRTRRRRCWGSCATRRCWRWPARCWPRSPGRTSSATSPAASWTTWWSSRRTTGPRSRTSG